MDTLIGYVATGTITFIGGYALQRFEPKAKLVYWNPHFFVFDVPDKNIPAQKFVFATHAISVQNIGKRTAEKIEIVHKNKPDFFKLQPSLDYEETRTPSGEHVLHIKSLGPKEFFTMQILSYSVIPDLQFIRSQDGHAQSILIQQQRIYSKWFNGLLLFCMIIGTATIIYWTIRTGDFISQLIHSIGAPAK